MMAISKRQLLIKNARSSATRRRMRMLSTHLRAFGQGRAAACTSMSSQQSGSHEDQQMVALAITGTLQEGFWLRNKLDHGGVPAQFVGWALCRGLKAFLDIKEPGCREWHNNPVGQSHFKVAEIIPVCKPQGRTKLTSAGAR